MNIKGILGTIGKTALPALAAATVPGSPLLGIAAKFIGDKLGAKIEPNPEAIDKALNDAHAQDPEVLLKLKEVDVAFQEYMTKLGFDNAAKIEELCNSDRASARAREIAVKDNTPKILAYAVTVGFFAMIGCLFYFPIPTNSQPVIFSLVGVLGTAWIAIITYYFGSSSQSAGKTQMIADQAATAQANLLAFKKAA